MNRWLRALTVLITALSIAAIGAPTNAAQQATSGTGLVVTDARGDGAPDIVSMTVDHSTTAAAFVRVEIRGVRSSGSDELQLFVDPSGRSARPSYVIAMGISGGSEYILRRTDGWRLRKATSTCGERVRLGYPAPTVRVVKIRMPYACFGNYGARFATKAVRWTSSGPTGTPDWAPGRRQLSRTFRF